MVGGTYLQIPVGPNTNYPTPNSFVRLLTMTDGTSNTILVLEGATLVPWTKPDDAFIPPNGPLPRFGTLDPNGFFVGMADATTRFVDRRRTKEATIRLAINPNDGQPLPPDWTQ
jgi:hypothetical protein